MSNLLHTIVSEVLETTSESDPRSIAVEVLAKIPDADLRECLESALICYVQKKVSGSRNGVPAASRHPVPPLRQPVQVSKKVASIRGNWARFLAERVHVSGVWKTMAECTITDVEALAIDRREKASQNLAHAKSFERLAISMRAQGAATVSDYTPWNKAQELQAA